jgi:hypothetical protein
LYDLIDKSQRLIIICLNTIGSQQEILATRAVSYFLNLPNHIIDYDFTYIPWYNLLTWVTKEEEEKLQNIHIKKQNNIDNNFKTFTIENISSNMQYIIHNFCIDYQ